MIPKPNECWCLRPIHYEHQSQEDRVRDAINCYGEFVNVKVGDQKDFKVFRVQRHYIGLHGLNHKDLAALGFEEVGNV